VHVLERTAARFRPTVAVIDLDAIRHNVRAVKPERAALMAVVKANGYGHGAVPVARAALDGGATWLGVALVEEGIRLREGGVDGPVLVLTEFPPGSEGDALVAGLTPTVYSVAAAGRIAVAARQLDVAPPTVHVKIDTGMHRVGASPGELIGVLRAVYDAGLSLGGLWTHLARSEDLDDPFTAEQLSRFDSAVETARAAGFVPVLLHAANSGAAIAHPRSHFDLVRVGIAMYGLSPGEQLRGRADLRPALSWKSAVTMAKRVRGGEALSYGQRYRLERDSTIATVPVGYADGYSRLLSNRADVLVRGRRRRVAGTVTMDQVMVDCGDDGIEAGEEVVLIGRQGREEVTAEELARLMGTIAYEVVCAVSERVPREYTGEER
jgi:alanine racemase